MVNNNDKARQRETLNRVISRDTEVIIKRYEYHVKLALRTSSGNVYEITRLVAQAYSFPFDKSGICWTPQSSPWNLIVLLANYCTYLYNVRLI